MSSAVPAARSRSRLAYTSSTMIGARPSDSSSATSSFGSSTSTRAMASIRCSPPESVPAICLRRLASAGNSVEGPLERRRRPRFGRGTPGTRATRFSSTVSVANTERPSGAWMIPARRNRWTGAPVMSSPSTTTAPSVGATSPVATRATVVLPTPFGPEQRDRLAGLDGERHVEQRTERPVAGRHVVEVEHSASRRRRPRRRGRPAARRRSGAPRPSGPRRSSRRSRGRRRAR